MNVIRWQAGQMNVVICADANVLYLKLVEEKWEGDMSLGSTNLLY